jgi:hypothetical protein
MKIRIRDISTVTYARITGVLYLVIIVFGLFSEVVVRGSLVVRGDAAATGTATSPHFPPARWTRWR